MWELSGHLFDLLYFTNNTLHNGLPIGRMEKFVLLVEEWGKVYNSIDEERFDTARGKKGSSGIVVHNYTQQSMNDRIE